MKFDTFTLIIGLLVIVGLIYYFTVALSAKNQRTRIIDLLVVGLIIWLCARIRNIITISPQELAGILIFAYGWVVLVIEKFQEGLRGD